MGRIEGMDPGGASVTRVERIWVEHPTKVPSSDEEFPGRREIVRVAPFIVEDTRQVLQSAEVVKGATGKVMRSVMNKLQNAARSVESRMEKGGRDAPDLELGLGDDRWRARRLDQSLSELMIVMSVMDSRWPEYLCREFSRKRRFLDVLTAVSATDPEKQTRAVKAHDLLGLFMHTFGHDHRPEMKPVAELMRLDLFLGSREFVFDE